jgi:protein AbiQ
MESLKIYKVQDKYIRYLSTVDHRVQYNKGAHRPYVGIVLTVGSYRYFVPMESPKPNHKKLKPAVHIMPLDGGNYGQLGFNNMIPIRSDALIPFDIDSEPNPQYAELLRRQASYINRHKADVFNRASKTYFRATTATEENFFKSVCCDFKKLERACDRYDPNYVSRKRR